jgi:hypothetical protein
MLAVSWAVANEPQQSFPHGPWEKLTFRDLEPARLVCLLLRQARFAKAIKEMLDIFGALE